MRKRRADLSQSSLFVNIDEPTCNTREPDTIDTLVEQRHRPFIFNEPTAETYPENSKVAVADNPGSEPHPKKPQQQVYSYEDALVATTAYFKGDTLAANVWINKYALKDSAGNLYELTPDDMHRRIAREIARIEQKYPNPSTEDEIFEVLKDFQYIVPQGSPMAGVGNDFQVSSLSNCFVIGGDDNGDSYGAIMKTDQEQVQLMKRRGGVGHDLSHIRPMGSPVQNSALTSTGIVPFMERFSNSTREVAQDGRRGALMLTISIKHPDAGHFIDAKTEQGKVTGANISVKIDDAFMQSVINNTPYVQQFPVNTDKTVFSREINARELWEKITHNAWLAAEPGVLFWDTIKRESIPDCYADLGFKTLSTNPCGEIPLCPYDSCRLLAINLFSYVEKPFTQEASFNSALFAHHAALALRMMDDIIDLETEKIDGILNKIASDPEDAETKNTERRLWEKIRDKTLLGRRTGIGITAEGDMLAALGLRYGSEDAINFSVEVHKLLASEVYRASVELAKERGAFPIFDYEREKNNPFIMRLQTAAPEVVEEMSKYGRRNIAMLTIAPTGSVSICTQTTSGIEPVFLVSYKRRRKVNPNDKNVNVSFVDDVGDCWEEYNVFHPRFLDWMRINGIDIDKVSALSDSQLQELIKRSPYYKATSNEIDWVSKVKMQGAIQKWVDHSISVTVNLPKDVSEELVREVYKTAWESGCKGMTIYREGSRSGVLVSNDKNKDDLNEFQETRAPQRPKVLEAEVLRFQNNHEKWITVLGLLNGRPYEIFTGKAEGFYLPPWVHKGWVIKNKIEKQATRYDFQYTDAQGYRTTIEGLSRMFDPEFWNYAKLISGILRHGMPLPYVVNLIDKLTLSDDNLHTWKNGVVRALKKFIPDGTIIGQRHCPECNQKGGLVYKEGCITCNHCGYSKCG
ncbi:MAG TPA: adenosylcobalamin-dependent ribonucleoside-diphosphate reductase [Bacteroidales bacterium]|nr:adenosylcobalamin-dependent ribonucleoside-diphosphate reductase [Bacteroidales bacterium]